MRHRRKTSSHTKFLCQHLCSSCVTGQSKHGITLSILILTEVYCFCVRPTKVLGNPTPALLLPHLSVSGLNRSCCPSQPIRPLHGLWDPARACPGLSGSADVLCALPKACRGHGLRAPNHGPKPWQAAKEKDPGLSSSVSMLEIFPSFLSSVQIFSAITWACSWVVVAQTQSQNWGYRGSFRKTWPCARAVSKHSPAEALPSALRRSKAVTRIIVTRSAVPKM